MIPDKDECMVLSCTCEAFLCVLLPAFHEPRSTDANMDVSSIRNGVMGILLQRASQKKKLSICNLSGPHKQQTEKH